MESKYCLFGDIVYSVDKDTLACQENGYLVIEDGFVAGVYRTLETPYDMYPVYDYKGYLILPGMTDLHVHAPQYTFKGMGMDLELLDWLNTYTFAEESKYASLDYANKAYEVFVDRLKNSTTTRACIFSTIHNEATLALMDRLETSGLVSMVGKVNMDRNASASLLEKHSLIDTKNWIQAVKERAYQNTSCILTPRFIPSCTDELMKGLSTIQKQYDLPVQSHLSENQSEIAWVQELCPWSNSYADAYAQFDLLGNTCKTIMAHCVYLDDADQNLLKERGVYVAHCPESNINLASGIAPIKTYLEKGMKVGLGSDVAAGSSESLLRAMSYAIQASKMYWRLVDQTVNPLSVEEVFYLATMSGGSFFGRVGSFQPGYEFDAVVIQDDLNGPRSYTLKERLERLIYTDTDVKVVSKFVRGKNIFEKN